MAFFSLMETRSNDGGILWNMQTLLLRLQDYQARILFVLHCYIEEISCGFFVW